MLFISVTSQSYFGTRTSFLVNAGEVPDGLEQGVLPHLEEEGAHPCSSVTVRRVASPATSTVRRGSQGAHLNRDTKGFSTAVLDLTQCHLPTLGHVGQCPKTFLVVTFGGHSWPPGS